MNFYKAKHLEKRSWKIIKAVIDFIIDEIKFMLNWIKNLPKYCIKKSVQGIDLYDDFLDTFRFGFAVE